MYLGAPITKKKEEKKEDDSNSNSNSTETTDNKTKAKKISEYKLPRDIGSGLLKFCLTHSDSPNLQDTVLPVDRDPKDYEWLRQAFDNLEDDAKRMKKILDLIQEEKTTNSMVISSLQQLEFYIEDLDNAGDLIKLGGIPILVNLLESEESGIRAESATCLAIVAQSEPTIQQYYDSIGVLDKCINMLSKETVSICREKYLSLISSIFGYDNRANMDSHKLEIIVKLATTFLSPQVDLFLTDSSTPVVVDNSVAGITKACFFLTKLFIAFPPLVGKSLEYGIVEGFINLISAFNQQKEHSHAQIIMVEKAELGLYQLLASKDQNIIQYCKDSNCKSLINQRLSLLNKDKEQYQVEIDNLDNILKMIK
ncbi:hypothetical protein CYY_003869 [Polysphondylium violaceum]|uniref:Nucleotide exchange factor Fes1 domain-containing protein n=1 Tax=Polysphondylium violaceum TaxID=133409 RepID=A0A8J4PVL0_9MYCE|nr:hypothetical protein CYY_003869 [Polysphondylium violaceum]